MNSRRKFLTIVSLLVTTFSVSMPVWSLPGEVFQGRDVFNRILSKSKSENWRALPIGELMGKIAKELAGTPYKSKTLEVSIDGEVCVVNLSGLDCVTFYENVLGFARMIKKGGHTPDDLLSEVKSTRYRSGIIGDFTSRMHYLSDWFHDNEERHIVRVLSDLPGTEILPTKISFMGRNPSSYPQLVKHPELVAKIKQQEDSINTRPLKFVPVNKIASVESYLKTGDIVAICTKIDGLDVAHTGLVIRTGDGVAHFMDASSRLSKVTLEPGSLSQAISRIKSWTGVIIARPLEP